MLTSRNSLTLLVVLLLLSVGCKKEEAPAPPPPAPPKPAPAPSAAPPAPPAPVQQQLSSASKVGAAVSFKRDPFKPLISTQPPPPASPSGARPGVPAVADLLPIQSFEVNKFRVSGIIAGLRENRALVIDPNGKGYVVQVGTQIGNANGRVSRITSSTVEVVEKSGRGKSRKIVLTLAKKR